MGKSERTTHSLLSDPFAPFLAKSLPPTMIDRASAPPPPPSPAGSVVLCINLKDATQRWARVQDGVRRALPGADLVRVDAVHWRDLSMNQLNMTPFTRWLVVHPERQAELRGSHRQMDTPSSIACLLSHIRCWEWLRARPELPFALVVEDDVCFEPDFPAAWHDVVLPLVGGSKPASPSQTQTQPQSVHCLVLGHMVPHWSGPADAATAERTVVVDGHRLAPPRPLGCSLFCIWQAARARVCMQVGAPERVSVSSTAPMRTSSPRRVRRSCCRTSGRSSSRRTGTC